MIDKTTSGINTTEILSQDTGLLTSLDLDGKNNATALPISEIEASEGILSNDQEQPIPSDLTKEIFDKQPVDILDSIGKDNTTEGTISSDNALETHAETLQYAYEFEPLCFIEDEFTHNLRIFEENHIAHPMLEPSIKNLEEAPTTQCNEHQGESEAYHIDNEAKEDPNGNLCAQLDATSLLDYQNTENLTEDATETMIEAKKINSISTNCYIIGGNLDSSICSTYTEYTDESFDFETVILNKNTHYINNEQDITNIDSDSKNTEDSEKDNFIYSLQTTSFSNGICKTIAILSNGEVYVENSLLEDINKGNALEIIEHFNNISEIISPVEFS